MAYERTSFFNVTSQGKLTYRVEFYDQGNAGAGVADYFKDMERTPGANAVVMKWGSDGSKMFAPLKPSTLTINMMVDDINISRYINELRTMRQERDVYVAVYRETVNGTNSPQYSPMWGGFLLMDLSDDPDIAMPWNVTLKAVDGIASLKYYDYVPTTTPQAADHLYEKSDTFINSGNQMPTWRKFTQIISDCLEVYAGPFTTAKGNAGSNPLFVTAVRWFNGQMPNINIDPLDNTRVKPDLFYKPEEISDDVTKYKPMTCYDVLKAVCKAWGMRCIYWRNQYYFIQVNFWDEVQSGTQLNPVDIKNYRYYMNGNYYAVRESIQGWWGTYQLYLSNTQSSPSIVNNKLAGGQYGILPAFKKVTVDFLNVANNNLFTAFPLTPPDPVPASVDWTDSIAMWRSTSLGVFTCDGINDQAFFQRINLAYSNNSTVAGKVGTDWFIGARKHTNTTPPLNGNAGPFQVSGSTSVDNFNIHMRADTSGTYTSGVIWEDNFVLAWYGRPWNNFTYIPTGNSTVEITTQGNQINAKTYPVLQVQPPTPSFSWDVFTAGDWELAYFSYSVATTTWTNVTDPSGNVIPNGNWGGTGRFSPSTWINFWDDQYIDNPWYHNVSYANVAISQGIGASEFAPITNGAVGTTMSVTNMMQPGQDTAYETITQVLFGDTGNTSSEGCIQLYNGTTWADTDFSGIWGIDTLAGGNSFAEQLATDIFAAQSKPIHKFSVQTLFDPELGVYVNDGSANRPNFACPLTKWITPTHGPSMTKIKAWIMHTGEFNVVEDTWKWVLYEQKKFDAPTGGPVIVTNNDHGITGTTGIIKVPIGDPAPTGTIMGKLGNPADQNKAAIRNLNLQSSKPIAIVGTSQNIDPTATGEAAVYQQTVSSIICLELKETIFNAGDLFILKCQSPSRAKGLPMAITPAPTPTTPPDKYNAQSLQDDQILFEVATTQMPGDTSIDVVDQVIYQDITAGDIITPYTQDMYTQYQNQTRGSVAGFEVDANGLAKGGIEITGWLDDDTFATASVNTLATSESIKAYIDSIATNENTTSWRGCIDICEGLDEPEPVGER